MSRNGLVARCDRNAIRCDTSSDPGPGGASGRVLKKEINRRVITQHPFADFRVRSPSPGPDRERRGEQQASCHPGCGRNVIAALAGPLGKRSLRPRRGLKAGSIVQTVICGRIRVQGRAPGTAPKNPPLPASPGGTPSVGQMYVCDITAKRTGRWAVP